MADKLDNRIQFRSGAVMVDTSEWASVRTGPNYDAEEGHNWLKNSEQAGRFTLLRNGDSLFALISDPIVAIEFKLRFG